MPQLASVAEIVNAFDYRHSPSAKRTGAVVGPTDAQRAMWARADTGPRLTEAQ
jgi:hypothetical protein